MRRMHQLLPSLLLLTSLAGCDSSDHRVTRMAEQQARQNEALAQQHQQIASATRTLIEADKQAREDFSAMSQRLQQEQSGINQGRDTLEAERREIASQRYRDPVIAGAILNLGLLVACLLPFLVCLYVLRALTADASQVQVLNELLVQDFLSEKPLLSSTGLVRIAERIPSDTFQADPTA